MRTCRKCETPKDISEFNRDVKGREGYAVTCRSCKNANRMKIKIEPEEQVAEPIKPTIEIVEESEPLETSTSFFDELSQKFQAHFSISYSRKGSAVLNIHSNPQLSFRGVGVGAVVEQALAY